VTTIAERPAEGESSALVAELLRAEVASLRLQVDADLGDHALKTLDERGTAQELIRQQYTGRYPFELLQNANDAASQYDGRRRVLFVLTESALVVANHGQGFGEAEVRAICSLGRSSKDPRKSIGYKGLGFKSVGEITTRPQIYSPPYCFGFDAGRVHAEVSAVLGYEVPGGQHLPVYAFPFPLSVEDAGEDAALVAGLLTDGFATVMRLPFGEEVSRTTVATHIEDLLGPQLLLFLDSTDSLEVRGGREDFAAESVREHHVDHDLVMIQHGGLSEQWLVFRRRVPITDRSLVRRLGEAWHDVTEVGTAVAVPLDASARPIGGSARPLHVYFPLEDTASLPIVLHADFALDLDRRHVARTPEAAAYNDWLATELLDLATETVAPRLAELYPAQAAVVTALAPHGPAQGYGHTIRNGYDAAMAASAFVPCLDGRARAPRGVTMLPGEVPQPQRAAEHCDLSSYGHLVFIDDTFNSQADQWLRTSLRVRSLPPSAVLSRLRAPSGNTRPLYTWLVEWADAARRPVFVRMLKSVRCVRTTNGQWLAPDDRVFFPRERTAVVLPVDVPMDIADLPDVDGLHELMTEAGVRPFRWRELLLDRLLPLLADPGTDTDLRESGHTALRTYLATEGGGDQDVLARLPGVLVAARKTNGDLTTLSKAGETYFGADWLGTNDLELIYGPFGSFEFLAEPVPADAQARAEALAYFEWLGVSRRPRLDKAIARSADRYRLPAAQHPHRRYDRWWAEWLSSDEFQNARQCGQQHRESQQLTTSYGLDRLPELIANADPQRLRLLARHLAKDWAHYRSAMSTTLTCVNQAHRGENFRSIPSLLARMLTDAQWLPAGQQGHVVLRRPREVWRVAPDLPRRAQDWLPLHDPTLDVRAFLHAWTDLDVVDGARPQPPDLTALLRTLAAEWEATGTSPEEHSVVPALARWAMRQLNDALIRSPGAHDGFDRERIPLLAEHGDRLLFTPTPYVTDDPTLLTVWRADHPVLSGDRGLTTLIRRLGLRVLDDEVIVEPQPAKLRPDAGSAIEAHLHDAGVFLAAVAINAAPSRRDRILARLRNLVVVPCEQLTLVYRLDGRQHERADATTYLDTKARSPELIARHASGVLYLEVDADGGLADWYSLGPQLAAFLDVPSQSDAFILLLGSPPDARVAYLRSRHITVDTLDAIQDDMMSEPDADEPPAEPDGDVPTSQAEDSAPVPAGSTAPGQAVPRQSDATTEHGATPPAGSPGVSNGRPFGRPPAAPPLDGTVYAIDDAPDNIVEAPRTQPVSPTVPRRRPTGIDWGHLTETAQRHGRRGEEWAYLQERLRLQRLGQDPDLVRWISRIDELANHDLTSIDEDGETIYIEVKATDSADPATPFEITSSELAMAFAYRQRYFVHHVLDVNSPTPRILRHRDPVGRLERGYAQLRMTRAHIYPASRDDM
jgi:hypothetical protein